jgi:hypothetical protein
MKSLVFTSCQIVSQLEDKKDSLSLILSWQCNQWTQRRNLWASHVIIYSISIFLFLVNRLGIFGLWTRNITIFWEGQVTCRLPSPAAYTKISHWTVGVIFSSLARANALPITSFWVSFYDDDTLSYLLIIFKYFWLKVNSKKERNPQTGPLNGEDIF